MQQTINQSKNLWQIKNNNVQHKRITSREDKNYIRQRDLFAVAKSVVVAEILAKVQCSDGNIYSI